MATKEYRFKYGKKEIRFNLDPRLVWGELTIKDHPPLQDPGAEIQKAIRNPIRSKPLREIVKAGQTVAFLVNDSTRLANSHVFMPILLNELNAAGIPDRDMFIIFSVGAHRQLSEQEMVSLVGPDVAERVRMYNSNAQDPSQFKYVGTTSRGNDIYFHKLVLEADHVVCTGNIVYHFFAGFGGGRKALLPGVAAYQTICRNHALMLEPGAGLGKLNGNPVHEDQVEATEMLRPSFLLNVVLNEKKEFLKIFAGDYIQAHLEGCRFVEMIYGAEIPKPADLVIAGCGGYPKDINVYQLQKTMDNAWLAVRQGGVVIMLGECIEGVGSEEYLQWMKEHKTPELIEEKIRSDFIVGGHKAYAVTRLMKKAEFILVSGLDADLSRTLLFTPAKDMGEALAMAFAKVGPHPRIILMPQGSLTVPVLKEVRS
ncbi:MAG: nickel-dependent lactate racemase [Thermodesulfobacteriota bacterium]|nr:nickel-dependent lactate racemase [Thermodesulfobacteriota bacterium]